MKAFKILQFSIVLIFILTAKAICQYYPVSEIPDSLKENADAVIRFSKQELIMKDLDKCIYKNNKIITLLNRDAKDEAKLIFVFDPESKIKSVWAKTYNSEGKLISAFSRSDFEDRSYDPYGSLFLDTRYLFLKPAIKEYPITIAYEIEYLEKASYSLPDWYPIDAYNLSVQKSVYSIEVPEGYEFKYKEYNLTDGISSKKSKNSCRWELNNYLAIDYEPFSPDVSKVFPIVKLGPSKFEYDAYKGDLSSWKSMGQFFASLNEGRRDLSEETREKIKGLIDKCNTDIEKAKLLYEYMQSVTNYVSIQIGIGGLQPFPAEVVDEKGYGDCKALSNYMSALLELAEIKSYYALVQAGPNRYNFDSEFVNDIFNHVILCVPIEKDTIWLECTSQVLPFGFLGDFTDNRYALLVTENGGVLQKTTCYGKKQNLSMRKAMVEIGIDGRSTASVKTQYEGLAYDNINDRFLRYNADRQEKALYKSTGIPNFKLKSFNYNEHKSTNPSVEENLSLELINYCSSSGSRLFVPLNLMNKFSYVPPKDEQREQEIVLYREYIDIDTIEYKLPIGYDIEHLPKGLTYESEFGTYNTEIQNLGEKILYIRKLEKNSGRFPKEKYPELISFYKKLRKADNVKLILKKSS